MSRTELCLDIHTLILVYKLVELEVNRQLGQFACPNIPSCVPSFSE